LLESANAIRGEEESPPGRPVHALCVEWNASATEAVDQIAATIRRLDRVHDTGVLVLTEMFGDTPCNSALRASRDTRAAVVTGVNLPMVLSLCCGAPDLDLPDLANWVWRNGRRSVRLAAPGAAWNHE